jgi:hypothetical protein
MNTNESSVGKIMSTESFYKEIDVLVKQHRLNYMDAILYFCEKNNVEIEVAASMIKSNLRIKSQLQYEGEELNFLPKTARLPF